MKFTDIIALAWRNLRQAKLRTSLTIIGVIVGVAAIVTMVSFGLGLQNNLLKDALARIDLFTSITVMGPGADAMLAMRDQSANAASNAEADENGASSEEKSDGDASAAPTPSPTPPRMLDDAAIAELQSINGVRYVLPNFSFSNYVRFEGRTRRAFVGGAPQSIDYNPRFKKFLAGRHFASEEALELVVTEKFISWVRSKPRLDRDRRRRPGGPFQIAPARPEEERAREANGILGKEIVLLTLREQNSTPSSVFGIPIIDVSSNEINGGNSGEALSEFGAQYEERVYRIVGVLKAEDGFDINNFMETDMFIPLEQAKQFRETNRDPLSRMGELLAGDTGYQNAEIRVADVSQVDSIKDEIKKRGFRAWSFTNQVEEIRRIFLIVNSALALLGGISLLVASFGISNTMIMSIRERTREIGVMKAIGGSDREIMRIFFVEASLIGLAGGALGVLGGWGIDRVANTLANRWVLKQVGQAVRHIEFFSIPWYLSTGAILFAMIISLVAAIYPAMRAAKVDPIKALRYE